MFKMERVLAIVIYLAMCTTWVAAQRPWFAGSKPIGYPELYDATTESLGNRFGEENGTTPRLPIEAQGNPQLIDRISKLPVDQQPFWYLNWQALENHRKNPQTYPQKPNIFIENPLTSGQPETGNTPTLNDNLNNRNSVSSITQDTNNNARYPTIPQNTQTPFTSNSNLGSNKTFNNTNVNPTKSLRPVPQDTYSQSNRRPNFNGSVPQLGNKNGAPTYESVKNRLNKNGSVKGHTFDREIEEYSDDSPGYQVQYFPYYG